MFGMTVLAESPLKRLPHSILVLPTLGESGMGRLDSISIGHDIMMRSWGGLWEKMRSGLGREMRICIDM
jgi:hypothetical protein